MSPSSLRDSPMIRRLFKDGEFAILLVTGAFFLVMLLGSIGLRSQAAFFPRIVGVAGLILLLVLVLRYFAKVRLEGTTAPGPLPDGMSGRGSDIENEPTDDADAAPNQLMPILAAPAYAILLVIFGFYIAAGTVIAVLPWLLGYRRRWFLIGLAVGTVATLHIFFSVLLNIPIPAGIVGDWYLRKFVYLD